MDWRLESYETFVSCPLFFSKVQIAGSSQQIGLRGRFIFLLEELRFRFLRGREEVQRRPCREAQDTRLAPLAQAKADLC